MTSTSKIAVALRLKNLWTPTSPWSSGGGSAPGAAAPALPPQPGWIKGSSETAEGDSA
jgi:hypothetical protein